MNENNADAEFDLQATLRRVDVQFRYDLNNLYTTRAEKLEIESWFQLPCDVAGHAYAVCSVLWAIGNISGWEAYWISCGIGMLTASIVWVLYFPKAIILLAMIARAPYVGVITHLAVVVWLAIHKEWKPAALLLINTITFQMLTNFPVMMLNKLFTIRHRLHQKYALLKIKHGKVYDFEC